MFWNDAFRHLSFSNFIFTYLQNLYQVFLQIILFQFFNFCSIKRNCCQYYYTIKYITNGTVPHYAKHMNNIKEVHRKETIMTSGNITEAVTQKQSTEKNGAHPQRNTHVDVQIQWKPGGNNTETTRPHRCSPQNLPHISRASPIGKYLRVNTSDLYIILDMGGTVLQVTSFTNKRNTI